MYPRVVILSLTKRVDKPHFYHSYTSFGVWHRDNYMSLQRFTTGVRHALLWFPLTLGPTCSAKVSSYLGPLLHLVDQITFCVFSHTTEKDSQPIAILISKQAIPYRTRGDTYCPGVSTPKIRPLADSSNHKL
jgi:hypothetical protein